jgi:hypothetical protein
MIPQNGTITDGDIIIEIPEKRVYPFPKGAVKAVNSYDLLEQFPNGLPFDVFADTKFRPLAILEPKDDKPLTIFSFGPDTDEFKNNDYRMENAPGENPLVIRTMQKIYQRTDNNNPGKGFWKLDPYYDPTNGTVTPGDLCIEIPKW